MASLSCLGASFFLFGTHPREPAQIAHLFWHVKAMSNQWSEGGQVFSALDRVQTHWNKRAPGTVSGLTCQTTGGQQPAVPHFLGLYGLDSTREPPETVAGDLDL